MFPFSCHYLQVTPEGQPLYADSIESLVRNKIQAMKIDMANEVIDAGRFDMQTSMAERRETLEQMLQVPSLTPCIHSPRSACQRSSPSPVHPMHWTPHAY